MALPDPWGDLEEAAVFYSDETGESVEFVPGDGAVWEGLATTISYQGFVDGDGLNWWESGTFSVDGKNWVTIEASSVPLQVDQLLVDTGSLIDFLGVRAEGNKYDNKMRGGDERDVLKGRDGDDTLYGKNDDDKLYGGSQKDYLNGGSGDDRMKGGDNADRLVGGSGEDDMWGNGGADRFEFRKSSDSKTSARDTIHDFDHKDVIDLSRIDAREDRSGDNHFKFIDNDGYSGRSGELRYDHGSLRGDTDGDGSSDFAIKIDIDFALTDDHFIL
jgi:Ca2+-binding RTX toxin-like protein